MVEIWQLFSPKGGGTGSGHTRYQERDHCVTCKSKHPCRRKFVLALL